MKSSPWGEHERLYQNSDVPAESHPYSPNTKTTTFLVRAHLHHSQGVTHLAVFSLYTATIIPSCSCVCMTWRWLIAARVNLSGVLLVAAPKGLVNPAAIHWAVCSNSRIICRPLCACLCFRCARVFRQWDGVHGRGRRSPPEGGGKMASWECGTQIQGLVWLLPTLIHRCLGIKVQQRYFCYVL